MTQLVAKNVFSGITYTTDPAGAAPLLKGEVSALKELCEIAGRTDPASRRITVEQCWRARLYQRGYQKLIPQKRGGWQIPGAGSAYGNGKVEQNNTDTGQINVYGRDHDVIVSALSSEVPKVRFFPHKTSEPTDVTAADAANSYKYFFTSANCLEEKLGEIGSFFFTDGISVCFTRSVQSSEFGFVDTSEIDPFIPETMGQQAPASTNTPRIREVTNIYGALEAKVPTSVQHFKDMQFLGLFWEEDEAVSKAYFPHIAPKIQAGGAGIAELELDRTARLNVQMNMGVGYTTGDTIERQVTRGMWFLRPSTFTEFSGEGERGDILQQQLIAKFPDGVLIEFAGTELAQATSLNPDDHLCVLHSNPGSGQNRRSLGHSSISLQDRLNRLSDLQMDYFTRTVPRRYYDAEAFDLAAMAQTANIPGNDTPFLRQPNVPLSELMGTDPVIQANPQMLEFIDKLEGQYSQDMTGALPSLFGGASDTNTVGNAVLQRNQALQRISYPNGQIKRGVCTITKQAVQQAAKNGNDSISDTVKGIGRIQVEMSDLRGNVLCYPESDSNIPESWAQRQGLFLTAVEQAGQNPFYQQLLSVPSNSRVAKDAIGFGDLEVPGAASTEKQQAELDLLKKTGPVPNPQLQQIQEQILQGTQHAATDPQAAQMLQQLQQAAQSLPPEVSTIPVMQDASEEHAVEAAAALQWLISPEGRTFKNGTGEQRAAWANVHLHWQEHSAQAAKLAPPAPPAVKASITIAADKLPPAIQAQIFQEYGLEATPDDFEQGQTHEVSTESETPTLDGGKVKQVVSISGAPLK
jgi:hypothetical protein